MKSPVACEVHVLNNGARVQVPAGECILDAALAQGVALPHQCRGASCGECKARVVSGAVDHGWSFGLAISEEEKAAGLCLCCQAKPLTPQLQIETLRPVGGGAPAVRQVPAQVAALTRLTPRVARLVLVPETPLAYEPGSYAELVLPGVEPNRMYSFAGPGGEDGLLEFFVALHPGGRASGYVHEALQLGDSVEVRGPFGSCRMPGGAGPVLGLAGGTGLAPVLAIFEHSLRSGASEPHTLLLSVREDAEVFALDRLQSMARRHPNFSWHVLVTETPSRFCAKQQYAPAWIAERHASLADQRAVIGGSPGFVQACAEACRALGMAADAIATDSFTPAVSTAVPTGDKP